MTHSRKILSQSGTSLADVYDVEGSVAGLEELEVSNIQGVHELGGQIHSERLNVFNLLADSTAVAQSTAWNIALGGFPDSVNRLLGIAVVANEAARVANCSIHVGDPGTGQDHPIWVWDDADDVESEIRWANDVAALETIFVLRPASNMLGVPTILGRTGDRAAMPNLIMRGISTAFGAGTVQVRALIQVARPDRGNPSPGEPSSFGLPIPGW